MTNVLFSQATGAEVSAAEGSAGTITIFYSDTQKFGNIGKPQRQINVLGTISQPRRVTALSYTLNGSSPRALRVGADKRRLVQGGDFNAELDYSELLPGANHIVVTAIYTDGSTAVQPVTVNYFSDNLWPSSYVADWNTTNIQDLAQVVDGQWVITSSVSGGNVRRPLVFKYDRLVAIGETTWTDYEITVPVTIHGLDPDPEAFRSPSFGPGVGLVQHWQGHYQKDVTGPTDGWEQFGSIGWFRWRKDAADTIYAGLQLLAFDGKEIGIRSDKVPQFNVTYIYKLSAQTSPGKPYYYRLKVWPAAEPEPWAWDLEAFGKLGEPPAGSLMLIAHHADASFGTVTVRPLSAITASLTVATDGNGTVAVTPTLPSYVYGQAVRLEATPNLGLALTGWGSDVPGKTSPQTIYITKDTNIFATFASAAPPTVTLRTDGNGYIYVTPDKPSYSFGEVITFTATPKVGYQFANWTGDVRGSANPRAVPINSSLVVTANFGAATSPVSDDFNTCALNTERWTFRDPVGDSTYTIDGKRLLITVPSGADHNLWVDFASGISQNQAPRLMQPANNNDFNLSAKFESPVSGRYTIQGLLIEQDENNFVRVDYLSEGATIRAFVAVIANGLPTVQVREAITPVAGADYYVSLSRTGAEWNVQLRSLDGVNWKAGKKFTHTITVNAVGVFAGNAKADKNTPSPAHTAIVDFFFNATSAVSPEDGRPPTVTINTVGNGTVARNPDKPSYTCTEPIQLTATPAPGSIFIGWSGALAGKTNPASLTVAQGDSVTATFAEGAFFLTDERIGSGTVTRTPDKPAYNAGEQVSLTAEPSSGWRFIGWTGSFTSSDNPLLITMQSDVQVNANFERVEGGTVLFLPLIQK